MRILLNSIKILCRNCSFYLLAENPRDGNEETGFLIRRPDSDNRENDTSMVNIGGETKPIVSK